MGTTSILHINWNQNGTNEPIILPWASLSCPLALRRETREELLKPVSFRTFSPRKHASGPLWSLGAETLFKSISWYVALWLIRSSSVLLSHSRPAASPSPFRDRVLHCNWVYLAGRVLEWQSASRRPQLGLASAPDAQENRRLLQGRWAGVQKGTRSGVKKGKREQ